jgi:hypothetical protein
MTFDYDNDNFYVTVMNLYLLITTTTYYKYFSYWMVYDTAAGKCARKLRTKAQAMAFDVMPLA